MTVPLLQPLLDLRLVDGWSGLHVLFGLAAARLRWRLSWVVAASCAWEWLEASGFGPVGADPCALNSLADVGLTLAAAWLGRRNHGP